MSSFAFRVIAAGLIGAGNSIIEALDIAESADPLTSGPRPAATLESAPAEAPKRRGRPPGNAAEKPAPVPTAEQEPAAPAPEPEPVKPAAPAGKSYEDLRELIKPLVEEGRGEEVKKVIAKYAPGGGGLKELAGLPLNHAAFEKDISALSY